MFFQNALDDGKVIESETGWSEDLVVWAWLRVLSPDTISGELVFSKVQEKIFSFEKSKFLEIFPHSVNLAVVTRSPSPVMFDDDSDEDEVLMESESSSESSQ